MLYRVFLIPVGVRGGPRQLQCWYGLKMMGYGDVPTSCFFMSNRGPLIYICLHQPLGGSSNKSGSRFQGFQMSSMSLAGEWPSASLLGDIVVFITAKPLVLDIFQHVQAGIQRSSIFSVTWRVGAAQRLFTRLNICLYSIHLFSLAYRLIPGCGRPPLTLSLIHK